MDEVWKARDTRLDRFVAVKISAEQFTDRFERETRVCLFQRRLHGRAVTIDMNGLLEATMYYKHDRAAVDEALQNRMAS